MKLRKMISLVLLVSVAMMSMSFNVFAGDLEDGTAEPQVTSTSSVFKDSYNNQFRVRGTTTISRYTAMGSTAFCVLNYSDQNHTLDGVKETGTIVNSYFLLSNGGSSYSDLNDTGYTTGYTSSTYKTVVSKTCSFTTVISAAGAKHTLSTGSGASGNVTTSASQIG